MDQQQWKKVSEIVDTALQLNGDKRTTYIEKECKGNEKLKSQVTELLESIEKSDTEGYLEGLESYPAHLISDFSKSSDSVDEQSSMIGKTIDAYKILELIGHGGMGSVFLADRADDVFNQKVALKILRYGMDTPSNIARFKRERHILAKLNHPNVAKLLDGGMTNDGLPYLVMEYVEGTPLFDYCDKHRLPVEERIDLYKSVCRAVQHAHNNAIIHRDLKPSNILVTENRQVKILDFGIAKLLEPENPDTNLFQTKTGARILTLGYAAPEQVGNEHITTSTDGYTLGLLLYELLAGVSPFEMGENLSDVEQQITEETPPKPSIRFRDLDPDTQNSIVRNRRISVDKLINILRGDLDAITMKALRKEPESRYESVNQMMEDLERREESLPIIAREDTFRYKASKFFRRYRTPLSTVAGIVFIITGIIIYYSWQITKERNIAQLEAEKAQQVSAFLTDMFQANDPTHNPEDTLTVAAFLEHGQSRINQLDEQPEVQAELLGVIGLAHTNLGEYDEADSLLNRSLKIRENLQGPSHPEFASSLDNYSYLQRKKGNFAEAESLARTALNIQRASLGLNNKSTATSITSLAHALSRQGEYETADSLYQQALAIQEKVLDPNHLERGKTLNDHAYTLRRLGDYSEAEKKLKEALKITRDHYGNIHPQIMSGLSDLGIVKEKQGQFAASESLYHKSLEVNYKLFDEPDPSTAQLLNNIAATNIQIGNFEEAESYLKKSLEIRKQILRPQHPSIAESYSNLSNVYIQMGKYDKARPLLQKTIEIDKKEYGEDHPYIAGSLRDLGYIAQGEERYSKAENYFRRSLGIMEKSFSPDHPLLPNSLNPLGEVLYQQGKAKEAEKFLRRAVEIRQESLDDGDWRIAQSKTLLGACLIRLGNYKESEKLLKNGYQTHLEERGASDRLTQEAKQHLADLYNAWEKPELADRYGS